MCLCNPKIEEHVLYQITPVVDGVLFGVKLHCDGGLEMVGDFDPNNGDQMMLLWKELAEDLPRRSCFPLLRVQEGVHLEGLTHYVIDPVFTGQPEVNVSMKGKESAAADTPVMDPRGEADHPGVNQVFQVLSPDSPDCSICGGSGTLPTPSGHSRCDKCSGTGKDLTAKCRRCEGTGKTQGLSHSCGRCQGTGVEPKPYGVGHGG